MIRIATALGAGLLLAGAAVAAPIAPGASFLVALDTAPAAAVARVSDVRAIDGSGYAATLTVVTPLRGSTAGAAIPVLWEELARSRPLRLADGDNVAVVLDDLPPGSLWKARGEKIHGARVIAGDGSALLRSPTARDTALLARYAALPADSPAPPRAALLLELAGTGSAPLAVLAIDRLTPDLVAAIPDAGLLALLDWARDAERPLSQRAAIITLVGAARRPAARPALEALAKPGGVLEADALTALATDGGLPPERAEALLERPEPAIRVVGARALTGGAVERRLPALARSDPDPRVRAAAAVALARTNTAWGFDGCVPALADADPSVRSAAAGALGALGATVVPRLEDVARTRPAEARGALTALALAGPTGQQALRRLCNDLPDPKLRDYARLALGQGPHAH